MGSDDLGNVVGHVGRRGSNSGGDVFESRFMVEVEDTIHRLQEEDEHYPGGIVSFEYGSCVHNPIIGTSVPGEGNIEVCICAVGRIGNGMDEVACRASLYGVDSLDGKARVEGLMLRDKGDRACFTEVLGEGDTGGGVDAGLVDEIGCVGDIRWGVGEGANSLLEGGGRTESTFDGCIEQSVLPGMFARYEDVPGLLGGDGGDGAGVIQLEDFNDL
jgi:hypothetical protein